MRKYERRREMRENDDVHLDPALIRDRDMCKNMQNILKNSNLSYSKKIEQVILTLEL